MNDETIDGEIILEPLTRLTKDIKLAAKTLSDEEARYLVDTYYQLQGNRIRSTNQLRTMNDTPEPHLTLSWVADNAALLERSIRSALGAYSDAHLVGQWSQSIIGIGPVLSAGLLAHIDLEPWQCGAFRAGIVPKPCRPTTPHDEGCHRFRIDTVGQIWRFAGLDPTVQWNKGEKRPWNASLKTLTWKIGESFVKVSGHADDVYGHLYVQRKAKEQERNEAGLYADQAAAKLMKFKINKKTDAYKTYADGRLPLAHVHARAKRWAVKIFLAHWHAVAFRAAFGVPAPKPYILTQPTHTHEIVCPNWPFPTT